MASNKKEKKMAEVSKGFEAFIKGKKLNSKGAELFEKVIKKAAKPKSKKQPGLK